MNYESYRGIFNADINMGATPSGVWDIPLMCRIDACPKSLVGFDRINRNQNSSKWVHFCIHDARFAGLWRNPWKYLPRLKLHAGIIAPDFSIFWDYPRYMQLEAVCRSRAVGAWAQRNGVRAIPFIRWGKKETYEFAFDGVEPGGTIAIGTVGCMGSAEAREVFEAGFDPMLEVVRPSRVLVIGSDKSGVFQKARAGGVEVIAYEGETARFFREGRA